MSNPSFANATANNPDYLLKLFQKDMQDRLVKVGIEAVRPAIMAAAREAVLELDSKIRAVHDTYGQQVVVHLTVNEVKP